ncbi:MAG: DNA-deoxyinosine glycosylase [Corallococcus sp.]|nr:DNA-deoxyinosine glycosylase [Corallococcus sp.]MCM1359217.1 DNA-deoxyinosine glycosylase [Corallococcus sp.]MCM1394607.1 DNA-deoxyinosine glycosylase [Corallococcus sp.]
MARKTQQDVMHRTSFNPIVDDQSVTLILGIAPHDNYIEQGQYYCNPNDCFWEAIGQFMKAPANFPSNAYNTKLFLLKSHGIALWDIVHECDRVGATNKDIIKITSYNDIPDLLDKYPSIENIVFNGKDTYTYFKRSILAKYPNNTNLKRFLKKNFIVTLNTAARTTENREKILADWQKKVAPLFK